MLDIDFNPADGTKCIASGTSGAGALYSTNGGVNLIMPDNYSAHLETGTVNGNVSFGFPVNVPLTDRGRMPKSINVDVGAGGPTIRATTTNGGVRVGRQSVSM